MSRILRPVLSTNHVETAVAITYIVENPLWMAWLLIEMKAKQEFVLYKSASRESFSVPEQHQAQK